MSKMYVILVIILIKTIVSADDSSDETKYIDLLPEKEKEDFLDRIARRIFDGVQSKDDRDAMSGAVSDAELDEQDKFVKDILKEESLNLRKNGNVDINDKRTENIDTGNKNDENSNAEDETLSKKDIQGYVDESGLVDLTLRDGKRNKRNSFRKAKEDSKIIHVSVGNGEIDSPGEKYFPNEPLMQEQFDEDDIQIKNSKRSLGENTNELEISTPGSRMTQMVDFNDEPAKDDSDEAIPNGSEETSTAPEINISESTKDNYSHGTTEINSNDDETIGNDNSENNQFGFTQKIFASFEKTEDVNKDSDKMDTTSEAIQSTATSEFTSPDILAPVEITDKITHENNSLESHNNASRNARVLRTFSTSVYLEDNKAPKVKDILKDNPEDKAKEIEETQTDLNNSTWTGNDFENITSDLIPTEKTTLLSVTYKEQTTEKNDDVDTTTLNFDVLTKTSLRTNEEATEEKENKKITTDEIINLKPSIKTLDNTDKINSKESMGDELKNIKKGQEEIKIENEVNNKNNKETKADEKLNKITYNLANDMIKALRTKIIPAFNSDEKNFNGLQALYEAIKPDDSEYKVYAVPEGKQPFKEDQQDTSNKDSPYYVPVYNYSPDNAYYNPHNRLGPNADDDDENVINVDVEADGDDALHSNENSNKNEAKGLHDTESSSGSEEFVRESYNKERYNVENLLRELTNYNKTRKYRFIAKNFFKKIKPIKLNLPAETQHPKFADTILSSNGYANNNYYYGRSRQKPCIRNRCETDKKKQDDDDFFKEDDHPNNNVDHEKNLKDHIRAARLLLFRQKHFGIAPKKKSMESVESSKDVLRAKQTRSEEDRHAVDNNIAMDYFFGRMNGDAHTTKNKGSKYLNKYYQQYQNKNMLADGYKNRLINGNKKHAYKYDEIPYYISQEITNNNRDNQIKIPYKAQSYVNSEIKPATPMYKHEERLPRNFQKLLRKKIQKTKSKTMEFEELKKLLSMTDANDLLPTLDKLKKLNLTTRTDDETYLEPYVTVLGDMVKNNAKALKQYNWLQTTVDIQAALAKIIDMTDELQNNLKISQPDLQLLKYIIYLHKTAKTVQAKDFRKKPVLLPRNRKKKKGIITESGILNRQWLFRMLGTNHKRIITTYDLDDFNDFINDLQYYLYDFHTAVQQIANITKFNRQKWFENLKEIYLNTEEKRLLEVLLHITTTRLIDLIEESAKNGVEEDYLTFVLKNEKEVERAVEEFGVVLKIIDELKLK